MARYSNSMNDVEPGWHGMGARSKYPVFAHILLIYYVVIVDGASILHGQRFPTPHIATQHQLYISQTNSQQTDRVVCLLPESANGPWGKKWVVYELPGQ